jgi:hypothetical protein
MHFIMFYSGQRSEVVGLYACGIHAAIRCLHPLEICAESLRSLGIQMLPSLPSIISIIECSSTSMIHMCMFVIDQYGHQQRDAPYYWQGGE